MGCILILDDEPMLRELYQDVLGIAHEVLGAGTVGEAIRILERQPVDAVISDHRLPDGSSDDVLAWLREHRPELLERTTVLSGDDAAGIHAGDVLVLCKPLPMETLLDLVTQWFGEGGEDD
ncbi:MAG: response regulator [Mariprofundaceae bacterium]